MGLTTWVRQTLWSVNDGAAGNPLDPSVQPKPLFWFRSDIENNTQIGRYFRPIPKLSTF